MLLKVGARSVVVVVVPPTSRHSSRAEFPSYPAHKSNSPYPFYLTHKLKFKDLGVPRIGSGIVGSEKGGIMEGIAVEFDDGVGEEEGLSVGGEVYRSTLRLVECSMFAALSGLVYFLSNSLNIEPLRASPQKSQRLRDSEGLEIP
ncbi:hypothetical protein MLD38_007481 [Melastoma candidum]|uniref:Uncharacterized protein n=1 Tax=Melastoma candidum TaxID=119954 RepID=A0ACB9RRT5_9MYRT|nr:hypothetical protein MLD38_007481 [Melastoma candidum]